MGDFVKNESSNEKNLKRRSLIPPTLSAPCIELSGNRELLIEGGKGVLEYSPALIRVNTAAMIIAVAGRDLNLRCISDTSLMIDGFITKLEFSS